VIGILDWELSTIGHPLSDVSNLTMPWAAARESLEYATDGDGGDGQRRRRERDEFIPGREEGLPSREEVINWYSEAAGWDPKEFSDYGDAFTMFRVSSYNSKYGIYQTSSILHEDLAPNTNSSFSDGSYFTRHRSTIRNATSQQCKGCGIW